MNRVTTVRKVTLSSVGRTMAPACFLGLSDSRALPSMGENGILRTYILIPLDESQTEKEEKEEKWLLNGEHQEFVYLIQ